MAAGVDVDVDVELTIKPTNTEGYYTLTIDSLSFTVPVKKGRGAAAILRAAARVAEKAEYNAWVRRVTERL